MKKLFRFFDDPVSKLGMGYTKLVQRQLRKAISAKYNDEVPEQVYWIPNTEEQNKGLSNDKTEFIAQRLTLSQVGYFIAHRLWAKLRYIIFPLFLILGLISSYLVFNSSTYLISEYMPALIVGLTLFVGFFIAFGGVILAPFTAQILFPNTAYTKDEIKGVEDTIKRCVVRDIDSDTPSDFKDRLRTLDVDENGRSVAGQVLAMDFEYSAVANQWGDNIKKMFFLGLALALPAIIYLSPLLGVITTVFYSVLLFKNFQDNPAIYLFVIALITLIFALFSLSSTPLISEVLGVENNPRFWEWATVIYVWFAVFIDFKRDRSPLEERAEILESAVKQTGTELLIDKVGRNYFLAIEDAKKAQLENVKKDKSPFIKLGTTTGLFAERRDPLAPSESGLDFGLTVNDLSTHLFTLGASGTGKTTGVIRPVAHKWLEIDGGGLLVIDGKGALPLELQDSEYDYHLISPKGAKFNPIQGMKPDAVADTLGSIFGGNSGDPFWENSATLMIRMASIIAYYSSLDFTLNQILKICTMKQTDRVDLLFHNDGLIENINNPYVVSAINYWSSEFPEMPEKTSGSIVNIVRTWLGNIVANEKLGDWVNTVDSENIEDVFTGKKMGVLMPESEYGQGGIAISALVMRRLYDSAKKRGDNWHKDPEQKPVLLVADEIQNLLTNADIDNVAIARSLGLYLLFATQNVDGLYKKLDKDGAIQMLGNFASLIALPPRTTDSNNYVSQRSSKIWKSVVERFEGLPDSRADLNLYLENGTDKQLRGITLFNQAFLGNPRNAYLMGAYSNEINQETGETHKSWTLDNSASATVNIKIDDLINPDELDTLLSKPQTAIALINRGRVQRRDVIQLGLMGAK